MIEVTKAYKTSDGITHATIEGAQEHALDQLQITCPKDIVEKKDDVINILKMKSRKARTTKPKAPKAPKQ